jgi:hypothetical protein
MTDSDNDRGRSRRLGVKDGTSRVLGSQTIGRSGDTVCNPHHTRGGDEKHGFPGLASKPVVTVCQWFGLKTTTTVFWFGPENQGRRFGDLDLKITTTVSWFRPQNQGEKVCRFAHKNR